MSPKLTSSYKGKLGVKSKLEIDSAFIVTMDDIHSKFSFSSVYNHYTRTAYLTADGTLEDIHPFAFIFKVQTHEQDNPTYKDILKGSDK